MGQGGGGDMVPDGLGSGEPSLSPGLGSGEGAPAAPAGAPAGGWGLDLLRCESLAALDAATCGRLLRKNYHALFSLTPLARDTRTVVSAAPPHLGPALPETASPWFKLWLYSKVHRGG